ncbi:MAG: serine/threonine protein kinase [Clostridia bacterium]|nr:serine/threonine protein kinase [Clostridia bacterium]
MLANGTVIDGKYEILSKVGQGGMSVVYLAINRKAMKQWAIKEVRRDGVKDFEVVKQSLVAETDMLKKLSHPNLPDIVDIIETEDSFLIVMDYIEGKPLNKRIEESGPQPEEYVVEWAKQLCDVLDYLHTRQPSIIYRDMKPSNVMLKPDGSVCLIDFGTAREYKGTNIQDTTCLGTIGYAAPEQFGGQGETDARTDIYCLGATLYHLVTGHSPAEPPYEMYPIRQWDPQLSPGLEAIILKCIQKDPNDRYQSCAELKYALENMEENTRTYWVQQKKKFNTFLATAIAMVVFLLVGITGTILGNANSKSLYEKYVEKASGETGADAVADYEAAFSQGYMNDKPENLANYFANYMQAFVDNDDTRTITADELKQFQSYLGTADESKEDKYVSVIQRDDDAYVTMNYKLGIKLLQFAEGGTLAQYNTAKTWFVRAYNEVDEADLRSADSGEKSDSQIDYELAQKLVSMIDGWNEINNANKSNDVYGETVNFATLYKKLEDAVDGVIGQGTDDGVKLKVFEVFANFLEDSDFVEKFAASNGNKLEASNKWDQVLAELDKMTQLDGARLELKNEIVAKNATIHENLATKS